MSVLQLGPIGFSEAALPRSVMGARQQQKREQCDKDLVAIHSRHSSAVI